MRNKMIVAKFGGTSVKTAAAIQQVRKIIAGNPHISAIVVSAVGGITNLLVEFSKALPDKKGLIAEQILAIHLSLSEQLQLSLEREIESILKKLWQVTGCDHKDLDFIVSLGEDLSALIVSTYLQKEGILVKYLDARSFMITDDHYGKASPQLDKIKAYPFPQGLFITQGFIGATENAAPTTLGRGGSDYSAALIAEAMQADELLIYTDVPGVYTSDPNRIKDTKLIPELTFHEMAEMANFGAKILHPATLEPCVRAKIPIRILSTFEPEKPGTLVTVEETACAKESCISAITMRSNQFLVTIKSLKMLNAYGFLANIFTILARHKISIDLITTSEVSVALTIDNPSLGSHGKHPFMADTALLCELEQFAEITIEEDLTLLAIVGYHLTTPGIVQKILRIIESYKVRLVCYGASNSSISLLVPKTSADQIANLLHEKLLQTTAL